MLDCYIREALAYDPATGLLTWRIAASQRTKVGDVAGTVGKRGYRAVQVRGRLLQAHRIAWFLSTGAWPGGQIDHKNGLRDDNRLANLRLATQAQQTVNSKIRADNTSGHRGVSWNIGVNKWVARAVIDGKRKHLGCFANKQDAIAAYELAASVHYGDFRRH